MAARGLPAQITLEEVRSLEVAMEGGRYKFMGYLGSGAFGSVFLAQDCSNFSKNMAIKICCTGEAGRLDLQEVSALEAVDSNEVIAVDQWYVFQAGPPRHTAIAIVTEYCPNGNLNDYLVRTLKANVTVTKLDQMKFMRQVASGLAAIHEADIIHRDIKPANILLTEGMDVKIADLGIAKATWDISPRLNQDGLEGYMMTRAGTPAFAAPEIYSVKGYTNKVDIFSAGLVFVCITCPKRFFQDANSVVIPHVRGKPYRERIARQHGQGAERPTDTLSIRTSLPDFPQFDMATLIDNMLAKDASTRPLMEDLNTELLAAVAKLHREELQQRQAVPELGAYGEFKKLHYK